MEYCPLTGKRRFGTRSEALNAAANMTKRNKGTPSVYRCQECGAYHLTHYSYARSHHLQEVIATELKAKPKTNRTTEMNIGIDNAHVETGTVVMINNLNDGGQHLKIISFDPDGNKSSIEYTYTQALELIDAIKILVARMDQPK